MSEPNLLVLALLGLWVHESAVSVAEDWTLFLSHDGGFAKAIPVRTKRRLWRVAQLWPMFGQVFLVPNREPTLGSVDRFVRNSDDFDRTNVRAIREAVARIKRASRLPRLLGAVQFTVIMSGGLSFGGLGFLRGMGLYWAVLVLGLHLALLVLAHRWSSAPENSRARGGFMMLAISPLAALRWGETRHRLDLARFDPVAVALVLSDARGFRAIARDAVHALDEDRRQASERSPAAAGDLEARQASIDRLLRVARVSRGQLEIAEPVPDRTARSRCPSCGSAYSVDSGVCADCGDRLTAIQKDHGEAWRRIVNRISRRQERLGGAKKRS